MKLLFIARNEHVKGVRNRLGHSLRVLNEELLIYGIICVELREHWKRWENGVGEERKGFMDVLEGRLLKLGSTEPYL